jgi:hypothetical protein
MPYTMTTTKSASIGSDSYVSRLSDSGEELVQLAPTVPAAKTGTLTVRTDNDTGSLTMTGGHGITTGQKLDVFWTVAGVSGSRRNMTVGTVATNVVPIDGGSGDNLPAAASAITAMVPVSYSTTFSGPQAVAVAVYGTAAGYVAFFDDVGGFIASYAIPVTGGGPTWQVSSGEGNPLEAVTVGSITFSHADSTQARDMRAAIILNV